MSINKQYLLIKLLFFNCFLVNIALSQSGAVGSGHNGNLRLCVVEGRGSYKRASRFCPVLDEQNSGVECVLGNDRLDCLRRMGKGTVDFGVFAPEDLVAAQWSQIEVLVTNELRNRPRPFERSIVAVVNRKILPESSSTIHAVLRNTTFCHPGHGNDDRQPMSDTIAEYLESLVTEKLCNASLSIMENRIRGMAQFFSKACIAGPWVTDEMRDAELKHRYPSLCAACGSLQCAFEDRYWGPSGALLCLSEAAGDFTWAHLDNVAYYFGLVPGTKGFANPDDFAYLCRDGTWQPLTNNFEPCVWINRPWPVVVAKKKAAESVGKLAQSLTNSSVAVEENWLGALAALLEVTQAQPEPLQPAHAPLDYLANARGFREAYSQTGCEPPRHISLCTTTPLETNKCEWLSEAGNVYGVAPPVQCASKRSTEECLRAVAAGDCDVSVAGSDWLVRGLQDFSLVPLLHEATPLIQKANTVVAYIRGDDELKNMADWRQKRIAFPRYDGFAWHSVLRYFQDNNHLSCGQFVEYFSEICAPGIEAYNVTDDLKEKLTRNCYKDDEVVLDGEEQALRSLIEGKSDVAFFSLSTYNKYKDKQIQDPWAANNKNLIPVCPDENKRFCFISWSNIGHVYAPQNLTSMRRQEIVNVFTQLDQLFGKNYPFHNAMFSMYGPFNHQIDVLFHNNTRSLVTDTILETHPYNKFPLNFERNLLNLTAKSCRLTDFAKGFAAKSVPDFSIIVTVFLIFYFLIS